MTYEISLVDLPEQDAAVVRGHVGEQPVVEAAEAARLVGCHVREQSAPR